MILVNREQMYKIEQEAMKQGITAESMMELAGRGTADWIKCRYGTEYKVIVICGHGNNGGDGFVVARYLNQYGYQVKILFLGDMEKMTTETKTNYFRCQNIPITTSAKLTSKIFTLTDESVYMVIDARFGIGFRGTMPDDCDFIFHIMNVLKYKFPVKIAIDIPSGINANTGELDEKYTFNADFTLTYGFPKIGHFYKKAQNFTGKIEIIEIGIGETVVDDALCSDENSIMKEHLIKYIEFEDIIFPIRQKASHKGNYGRVCIIAGSPGYTGAAILACRAALSSGAGLITLYHQPGLETIFETTMIEVMTRHFIPNDKDAINHILNNDTLLIGPGIGKSPWALEVLHIVIENFKRKPLIIDADAINLIAENHDLLKKIKSNPQVYITPHVAEFARLMNVKPEKITNDPFLYLDKFTKGAKLNVLLKNHFCICRTYHEKVYKYSFIAGGNDGLAKGGSGDVLAGMITSFIAQHDVYEKNNTKTSRDNASWLYSPVKYFYSLAEKLEKEYETPAITPSLIINNIFRKWEDK